MPVQPMSDGSIMPRADQFPGDRSGGAAGKDGNHRRIATPIEDVPEDEMAARRTAAG